MGALSKLLNVFGLERKGESIRSSLDLFREVYGGWRSSTGQVVNHKTALQVSAVLACARVIGESLAVPPLKLMREANGKREPAREHPLYDLLHRRPNPWQTSYEYREMLGMHLAVAGAHYSLKVAMPGSGRIAGLFPFEPQDVQVIRDPATRRRKYRVQRENLNPVEFDEAAIWHIPGASWNGYVGLEIYKLAREAIGLSMATEAQHAKLHKNGAQVSGLLSVEGTLTDEKYLQMRKWLEKYFEGADNERAGRTMILDRGSKFTQTQMTGIDAQHLETRRYQVEEVCRDMRVMPIMVGFSDKATTYASAEQMFLAHLVYTMTPYYQRIEQSIDVHLLTDADRRGGIYADFVEEGLLRASAKDTKDMILGYVNGGLMTPNEGRAKLDLNPDHDPKSNELRVPANVVGEPKPAPEDDPDPKLDPVKEKE